MAAVITIIVNCPSWYSWMKKMNNKWEIFLYATNFFSRKKWKNELVLLRLYGRMVCNCNVESNNHIHTCGGCEMALLYDNPNLCHALYSCWSNYYGKNMMLGTPVRSYKSFLVFRQIHFVFFISPSIKILRRQWPGLAIL